LLKQSLVNLQNEVVLEPPAALRIVARGRNGKLRGRFGFNLQIKVQRHGGGVESRPQIG
jgi:hypothetical protein